MNQCMDVYKAKIQSGGSLDKLKLRIVVRGDLKNKELFGDTWSPTVSIRTLKYFLADATKHKAGIPQLDFIGDLFNQKWRTDSFSSSTVDVQIIFQNIQSSLE